MQVKDQAQTEPSQDALRIPRHVAIIMDGNGRWAGQQGLPRLEGHRAGVDNIRPVLEALADFGIEYVTIYAFSTENWSRPQQEVEGLMGILRDIIHQETVALHEQGVRILHLGRTDRLLPELREAVAYAQELTKGNNAITLSVAFDYGGRSEILDAVRRVVSEGVSPEDLDEDLFGRYLYTRDVPDPDLIIRTGGELRLSNFLLWQSAYSEYYTTATLWPDLGHADIAKAIQAYSLRHRRFGSIMPENPST